MTKGAPTKKKKEYRREVFRKLDFNNKCYKKIRNSFNLYELELNFYRELKNRYFLINCYLEENKIDIAELNDFSFTLNFDNLEECNEIVDNYFSVLNDLNNVYSSNKNGFFIEHISLKELLCNCSWSDENLDKLENGIKHFFDSYKNNNDSTDDCYDDDILKFFDYYSKGIVFGKVNGYEIYNEIKIDIYNYLISNDLKVYKDINKKRFGKMFDENKVILDEYRIKDIIEKDILSNLEETLKYLEVSNNFKKYEVVLKEYFNSYARVNKLSTITEHKHYDSINKIVNFSLDFNLSLETIIEQVKTAYNFFHDEKIKTDYDLLFKSKINPKSFDFSSIFYSGNKSKALNFLKEKYDYGTEKGILKTKIEYLVLLLFNFDCFFLCFSDDNIEEILSVEFVENYVGKNLSNKSKHYFYILNLIKNLTV